MKTIIKNKEIKIVRYKKTSFGLIKGLIFTVFYKNYSIDLYSDGLTTIYTKEIYTSIYCKIQYERFTEICRILGKAPDIKIFKKDNQYSGEMVLKFINKIKMLQMFS